MPRKHGTTDVRVTIPPIVLENIIEEAMNNVPIIRVLRKNAGGSAGVGLAMYINANVSHDLKHAGAVVWGSNVIDSFTRARNNGDTNRLASAYLIRSSTKNRYKGVPLRVKKIPGPFKSRYGGGSGIYNYNNFVKEPIHGAEEMFSVSSSGTEKVTKSKSKVSLTISADVYVNFASDKLGSDTAREVSRTGHVKRSYANRFLNASRFSAAVGQYMFDIPEMVGEVLREKISSLSARIKSSYGEAAETFIADKRVATSKAKGLKKSGLIVTPLSVKRAQINIAKQIEKNPKKSLSQAEIAAKFIDRFKKSRGK